MSYSEDRADGQYAASIGEPIDHETRMLRSGYRDRYQELRPPGPTCTQAELNAIVEYLIELARRKRG